MQHANRDRNVGAVLVAVLHRVHRRLGDSGLQPLDARRLESEPGDRQLDARHRQALVALRAGHLELVEDRVAEPGALAPGPAVRSSVIIVMSSSCSTSGPVNDASSASTWAIRSAPSGAVGQRLLEPREAEHRALRVVRLDDAVGVQQHAVARREDRLLLLVGHAGHQAERHAAGAQLVDALGGLDVGQVVAGVGEPQQAARRCRARRTGR